MSFKEVDDEFWRRIRYYMPHQKPKTGRPGTYLRNKFNGIKISTLTDAND